MERQNSGDFQKGNQWWRKRAKHGRDRIIQDPQILLESAHEYFEQTDSRKWTKKDWVGKDAIEVERENETPYTKSGLCVFLGIDSWRTIESLKNVNSDFLQVITHIENIIFTQKIEGASVGAFNASIVRRELGLQDSIDHTTKGNEIKSIPLVLKDGKTLDDLMNELQPE
jgi:hypothetical protein